jgi:hypothetical protein
VRGSIGVAYIVKNMRENRLRCLGIWYDEREQIQ